MPQLQTTVNKTPHLSPKRMLRLSPPCVITEVIIDRVR